MVKKCEACGRHLGQIVFADVLCKCGTYNIVRPNKKTKLVVKTLYTSNCMETVLETQ